MLPSGSRIIVEREVMQPQTANRRPARASIESSTSRTPCDETSASSVDIGGRPVHGPAFF
jgi:hypothetical protein